MAYVVMVWRIEYTDQFGTWWDVLSVPDVTRLDASVKLLETYGPQLGFPHSSGISGSRHGHMRELRIQSGGAPIRVFYAFDPRRSAILLIGGDKTGDKRFYERLIPFADSLYDEHLETLRLEKLI
jgi:hypothetical protein